MNQIGVTAFSLEANTAYDKFSTNCYDNKDVMTLRNPITKEDQFIYYHITLH